MAKVGDQEITREDFLLDYEFGFAQNRIGENSRKEYLNKMITELLLAEEGYSLKADTIRRIRNGVQSIREERLIEEVFNKNVLRKIVVTDEEIRQEVNKSAVSFQFRFIPAQSREQALELKKNAEEKGFDETLKLLTNDFSDYELKPRDVSSPYINAQDADPELLALISNLELNTISDPVQYRDQWYLLEVTNIKRQPLADYDYAQKGVTYRKVLYNRKAVEEGTAFINRIMTPKQVTTKRKTFETLNAALYLWYKDSPPVGNILDQVQKPDSITSYITEIQKILGNPLVEADGKTWSVERFLAEFNPARYQLRPNSFTSFTARFSDVVALVVRDHYLLELAKKQKLEKHEQVQRDIKKWENKWVFQAVRGQILDTLTFTNPAVQAYFVQNASAYGVPFGAVPNYDAMDSLLKRRIKKDFLNHKLLAKAEELKKKYPVKIYYSVLDTLTVTGKNGNPGITIQLLKQNSNRLAFPVVDPNW